MLYLSVWLYVCVCLSVCVDLSVSLLLSELLLICVSVCMYVCLSPGFLKNNENTQIQKNSDIYDNFFSKLMLLRRLNKMNLIKNFNKNN